MTALEKILNEIEELEKISFQSYTKPLIELKRVKQIIKKHLSNDNESIKCSECTRRKFYQMGYKDGSNDNDWIPCSERMPAGYEMIGHDDCGNKYMKRLEIAYMTDTVEYTHGYYDGYKWLSERLHKINNVIAWKVHKSYKVRKTERIHRATVPCVDFEYRED